MVLPSVSEEISIFTFCSFSSPSFNRLSRLPMIESAPLITYELQSPISSR
nr:MAG TPA: hypothetical protein [Herelleviridae sp.]